MERNCERCGEAFEAATARKLTCSDRCRRRKAYLAQPKAFERVCQVCGKGYGTSREASVVCSVTCRNKLVASMRAPGSQLSRNYGEGKCGSCGKYFTKRAPHAAYCSQKCLRRASYLRHPEEHKERGKIKVSKQRIGLDIRDETMKTPSKEAKWLWDGIGKWSVKYWPDIRECLECNTSVYRHNSNGVCERCYDRLRPRDPEQLKEWRKKSYERAKEKGRKGSAQAAKEWIEKAKRKEIPITPKIENLLENLARL